MNSLGTRYGMMRASHRRCILGDNVSKYRLYNSIDINENSQRRY